MIYKEKKWQQFYDMLRKDGFSHSWSVKRVTGEILFPFERFRGRIRKRKKV